MGERIDFSNKKNVWLLLALVFNVLVIILEIFGFCITFTNYSLEIFKYYTQLSNLVALISSCVFSSFLIKKLLKNPDLVIPKWVKCFRLLTVASLLLTFFFAIFAVAPVQGFVNTFFKNETVFQHILCPTLSVISFMFFEIESPVPFYFTFLAVGLSFFYGAVALTLNFLKVLSGPYPFFKVYEESWIMIVLWIFLIIGGTYLFAFLTRLVNKKMRIKHYDKEIENGNIKEN